MALRVRVRKGDIELEVSGTEEEISSSIESLKGTMGQLVELLGEAKRSGGSSDSAPVSIVQNSATETGGFPAIGKASGGAEAIIILLSSRWAEKPRTIGEIKLALETNGMPYPVTTISGLLLHLVKAGKVRRWKTSAGYVYRENVVTP